LDDAANVEFLKKIADGNEAAMHDFFKVFAPIVYAFALNRLSEGADAADVVNDVMLQVWKNAHQFEARSKVKTWVLGIANFKILDVFRKRGRVQLDELDDQIADDVLETGFSEIALEQDAKSIKHCMEKLSQNHRQVVHLAFFEDMAYPEIAETIDCPTGTVKTRMMHAKNNLKRCLQALQAA